MNTESLSPKLITFAIVLAWAITTAPALSGAENQPAGSADQPLRSVVAVSDKASHTASNVIGRPVRSTTGEELGELQDLVINASDGRIAYALVSSGSMGSENEFRVVPFNAVQQTPDENMLAVDLRGANWNSAPKIRADKIRELGEKTRGADIHRFFGRDRTNDMSANRSQENDGKNRLIRVSALNEKAVQNNGQTVGVIEDVLIDFDSRRASAVLNPEDAFIGTDKKFALSFRQLDLPSSPDDRATTTLTRADFDRARPPPADSSRPIAETDYPYVWGQTAIAAPNSAVAALGNPVPTSGINPAVTATAQEADEPAGKRSLAEIRGRLHGHRNLMKNADNITIVREGNVLLMSGSVPSADLKEDIEQTVRQMADGWKLESEIKVHGATE